METSCRVASSRQQEAGTICHVAPATGRREPSAIIEAVKQRREDRETAERAIIMKVKVVWGFEKRPRAERDVRVSERGKSERERARERARKLCDQSSTAYRRN